MKRATAVATSSQPPAFTSSFGVIDTSAASTLAELLALADAALYRAKANGRNQALIDDGAALSERTTSRPAVRGS